jgi:hypothetical protein
MNLCRRWKIIGGITLDRKWKRETKVKIVTQRILIEELQVLWKGLTPRVFPHSVNAPSGIHTEDSEFGLMSSKRMTASTYGVRRSEAGGRGVSQIVKNSLIYN